MRMSTFLKLVVLLLLPTSALFGQVAPSRTPTGFNEPLAVTNSLSSLRVNADLPSSIVLGAPPRGTVDKSDVFVPAKAIKEFNRAMKAFQAGDDRLAAGHLEKAVQIAPMFARAHNNLGAAYFNMGQYQDAAGELQKSVALNPRLIAPYHNLAMAMAFLGHFSDAEDAARQALSLAPDQAFSRFTLGRVLVMAGQNTREAVQLLTEASPKIPEAHLVLARLFQGNGQLGRAIIELRTYLQAPEPDKKELAEGWLARVTQQANATATAASGTADVVP
jgi:predicted O-linked N-acetylglucosamine transferase (SPINDLY family)